METKQFNEERLESWGKIFTKDESRVMIIMGMTKAGETTFCWDENTFTTPLKFAKFLEDLSNQIRLQNKNVN